MSELLVSISALPCPIGARRERLRRLDLCWPLPDLEEGAEELYAFDETEAIGEEAGNGPRIAVPLPAARFAAARRRDAPAADGEAASLGAGTFCLPAGRYAFTQFRAGEMQGLIEAMTDFVRDCWWQCVSVAGQIFLRRVREDGEAKLQLLRRSP